MARPPGSGAINQVLASPNRDNPGRVWAGVLQELPLFAGVPKRHIRKIASLTREARFSRGSTIVKQGERGDDFFLILDGSASVLRGQGLPPISIGSGEHFGEMALIDGGVRSATVLAETDVLCLRLERAPFQRMLKDEPEISFALLQELAGRLRELQARFELPE